MKKIILFITLILCVVLASAQTSKGYVEGSNVYKDASFIATEGAVIPFNFLTVKDSIKASDSTFYIMKVDHKSAVYPVIELYCDTFVGKTDGVVTMTLSQSMDGVHWMRLYSATSPAILAALTLAVDNSYRWLYGSSGVYWFEGKYFKICFTGASTSGMRKYVKGKVKWIVK